MIRTAAILARGLGSRMRRPDGGAPLDDAQARAADRGTKGMIAFGRPFLDHLLTALADAGITRVVLVIGPEHEEVRTHFAQHAPTRIALDFVEQAEPRGTADAVVAAADHLGEQPFLVLNADNLYPVTAIRSLAALGGPEAAVVAFDRDALTADGAIEPERIGQFAILEIAEGDATNAEPHEQPHQQPHEQPLERSQYTLQSIVEKPGASVSPGDERARWVSMNLWRVTPPLVAACRAVPRSERGEYELPLAVSRAVADGMVVRVVRSHEPVLDLSHRRDIAVVAERLRDRVVSP